MSKNYLGEFEELILTVVAILGDKAYGNAIKEEIKLLLDRDVHLSAIHMTMYRLEDKGYVTSTYGGATSTRGGRRKRYFRLTSAGLAILRHLKDQRIILWKLLPDLNK